MVFWPSKPRREFFAPFRGKASFNAKHLILVEQTEKNAL